MTSLTSTKQNLIRDIEQLPLDTIDELQAFVTYLQYKSAQKPKNIAKLGGLWKEYPIIDDDDIKAVRAEMWAGFGEREI